MMTASKLTALAGALAAVGLLPAATSRRRIAFRVMSRASLFTWRRLWPARSSRSTSSVAPRSAPVTSSSPWKASRSAAARDEAERKLAQARATLADLQKGSRPSEIASLEAQLKQAKVSLQYSERVLATLHGIREFPSGN